MSVYLKNQGNNETHACIHHHHQRPLMLPTTGHSKPSYFTKRNTTKLRSWLCLSLLMISTFLTVHYANCQQLLSAIHALQDYAHKRELQQQQQLYPKDYPQRYISNVLDMEESGGFNSTHPESNKFFRKYRSIINNANLSTTNHDYIFSNSNQILIVLNETLYDDKQLGRLLNRKYSKLKLNDPLRLNYNNTPPPPQPHMVKSNHTFHKQYGNSSRYPISQAHYVKDNKDDLENLEDDSLEETNKLLPNSMDNNEQLIKLVMDGLGLLQLPDMARVNVSQQEYVTKYKEYAKRVNERKKYELSLSGVERWDDDEHHWRDYAPLHMLSIVHNSSKSPNTYLRLRRDLQTKKAASYASAHRKSPKQQHHHHHEDSTSIFLHFPLDLNATVLPNEIEEANIKLMLIVNPALMAKREDDGRGKKYQRKGGGAAHTGSAKQARKRFVNIKVYQLSEEGQRHWLDGRKVRIELDRTKDDDDTKSHWLEFDVTKAVKSWLRNDKSNYGLELTCKNCQRHGARIIDDLSEEPQAYREIVSEEEAIIEQTESDRFNLTPVLNVIGRLGATYQEQRSRERSLERAKHYAATTATKSGSEQSARKADCYKANQRCCRHPMRVVFKEIKGFEFIIQPKVFDAGFCRGRCPPRYNPAHHHAMLQSLIWKQNRTSVPRPCCAPSKLDELEVLHVDEKDSDKLKISTWTNMRVLECACS